MFRATPNCRAIARIFLVGGSSRIPLAAHLIHTELGVAPTTLEQPETEVEPGAIQLVQLHDQHDNGPRRRADIRSVSPDSHNYR